MADNRKYYYLKLKENYFDDDSIVLLESMQDGILYSYILLKLYLKSLKHGGRLQLDESIPYTPQMIATITRQQIGTVERAIKIFLQLGLMGWCHNMVDNSNFLPKKNMFIKVPITAIWISLLFEKQMVLRASRLIRVLNVK